MATARSPGLVVTTRAHISVRLAELGVTAAEARAWALQAGLVDRVTRGLPSAAVLEAYAAAR